jgi:hypothetical protein
MSTYDLNGPTAAEAFDAATEASQRLFFTGMEAFFKGLTAAMLIQKSFMDSARIARSSEQIVAVSESHFGGHAVISVDFKLKR